MAVALARAGGTVPKEFKRLAPTAVQAASDEQDAPTQAEAAPATPTLAKRMRGIAKGQSKGHQIEVLTCNWSSYQVFRRCQFTFVGMSGVCIGISMMEITAALIALRMPRSRWPSLVDDVSLMSDVATAEMRRQAKAAET